jgi:hypothetical protein
MLRTFIIAATMAISTSSVAQSIPIEPTEKVALPATVTIPSNTEVILRMGEDLSTKGGQIKLGHVFNLTVAYDVRVGGVVAIPAGTPAKGEVTMRTGRAVFGKSGKMEIELRSIDLDGQRIPITGKYRQQGDGDTLAAVGAVVLAAPLLVITGKSASIPRGRELSAYTMGATTVVAR